MTITASFAVKRSNRFVSRVFKASNPPSPNSLGWPSEKLTRSGSAMASIRDVRSEEHTSELQSHLNLVCRLLLEKKKKQAFNQIPYNLINLRVGDEKRLAQISVRIGLSGQRAPLVHL